MKTNSPTAAAKQNLAIVSYSETKTNDTMQLEIITHRRMLSRCRNSDSGRFSGILPLHRDRNSKLFDRFFLFFKKFFFSMLVFNSRISANFSNGFTPFVYPRSKVEGQEGSCHVGGHLGRFKRPNKSTSLMPNKQAISMGRRHGNAAIHNPILWIELNRVSIQLDPI